MKKLFIALPLLAAVPLLAQGGPLKPGTMDPARVTAGSYKTDPNHTLVGWRVDHLGFSDYFGIFGDVTGTLVLDPKNPAAAKVDITIPVSKVTTASAGLTAHLLRAGTYDDATRRLYVASTDADVVHVFAIGAGGGPPP